MFSEMLLTTTAKKPQKRFVNWIGLPGMTTGTGTPVLGVMEIVVVVSRNKTESCSYVVSETPTAWEGRAFHLAKGKGESGSDTENESYDVYCASNGQDKLCQCKGFTRHGHCKHEAALYTLMANGKLTAITSPPAPVLAPTGEDWGFGS